MNYVESIEIEGFWGSKRVEVKFHPDLNFLIGPNGSGKTTIINLLSAILKADIPAMYAINFDRVVIKLKTIGSNTKPIIEIKKNIDSVMGNLELQYSIKQKSSDSPAHYGVEGPYDERIYRDIRYERSRRLREKGAQLNEILSRLVEVSWLSIHRTTLESDKRYRMDEPFESTVDRKINEVSRAFSTYFSALSSRAELESSNFQEHVFLSLLDQKHSSNKIFHATAKFDDQDKSSTIGVLRDLGVSETKAKSSTNSHFRRRNEAKDYMKKNNNLRLDDALVVSDAIRIGELIAEWRELQRKRAEIFSPKTQFESIINNLFTGKTIIFNDRNAPRVCFSEKDEEGIGILSSGEKQLFILLGEALLQEGRPAVFISDEPELSLHVDWQSKLFENIRILNNSCQIISATHSPDIVGRFQDRVIQIEDCILDV